MKSLLGNLQHMEIEPLQLVKYEATEKYTMHYDWFDQLNNSTHGEDSLNKPFNRLASIFVYLGDACSGGETYFPKVTGVSASTDEDKFSRTDEGTGLLIKPKRGNAVFWKNLHMNGSGDERLAHAGMPVESGVKFGLNVWSKYYPNFSIIGD
jgi:prolyl 4-hydroxylase